ncbi:MAG TPA: DNA-3-methyladenine glycosylase I [Steroidobacteraceae bacterium]|nr:DNA-3-methyladenine glycosylase I [Steroidobacteraceae bacterium]
MAEPKRRAATLHADGRYRCGWCGTDPLYVAYHDTEWGVPVHDERMLFEMLCLEGAQAGLSWITVLRKREHYRRAFDGFDAAKIARYTARRHAALLKDPGIVRNRLKVLGFTQNARAELALLDAGESLDEIAWSFAPRGRRRRPRTLADIRASTPESDALSKALKGRGFTFVGTTICYAFMQAVGIVDDHLERCFAAGARR